MTIRSKGYLFVTIQFLLLALILATALYEKYELNRPFDQIVQFFGIILISAGCLVFLLSVFQFGEFYTPSPVPREHYKLVTGGIYSLIRHPAYLSVLLIFSGIIIFLQSYYSLSLMILVFTFFVIKTKFEETQLKNKFPEYKSYTERTKRIIPFLYYLCFR
jgi:protein-S-isoprenylcysteine O-methyltransferase Ste14